MVRLQLCVALLVVHLPTACAVQVRLAATPQAAGPSAQPARTHPLWAAAAGGVHPAAAQPRLLSQMWITQGVC